MSFYQLQRQPVGGAKNTMTALPAKVLYPPPQRVSWV